MFAAHPFRTVFRAFLYVLFHLWGFANAWAMWEIGSLFPHTFGAIFYTAAIFIAFALAAYLVDFFRGYWRVFFSAKSLWDLR